MADRLNPALLDRLPPEVERPRYDRAALQPGIVHLGIGAFMRAHLAVCTEAAIARTGDLRFGIVGVSLRQPDTRDALAPQDGLYTVAVRDAWPDGRPRQRLQVIGCVREVIVAPEAPQAVAGRIADPRTRIVSLTVTEKGYCHDLATGASGTPRSAIGCIVRGLELRRAQGLGGVTLLSLDNLPANGRVLEGAVRDFAEQVDAGLAAWIGALCPCPNSMVDRIVPRTTDADRAAVDAALGAHDAWPVMAEPFLDWSVEDRFAADRPDWTAGGARFVAEAAGWERLKLRMLNGSHSSIAYLGAMAGWRTVDVAIGQPVLRRHVDALMRDEIAPTLPDLPGLDLDAYRASLLARFANPALAHRTQQIAMDGSQKLPQRLLNTVRDRIAAGQPFPRLALGIAAWLHYLRGVDETGAAHAVDDPLAAPLQALEREARALPDDTARARRLTGFAPVFGDLAAHPALVAALAPHLHGLRERGVVATLEALG